MAARVRETNRWDAVINGVNYRLKRAEGAYRKVSGRSQLEIQQMLNQAGNQFSSRRDLRPLFQTDWSGGAQWQKPLLSDQSIDTYYTSTGFDLISEPGNVFPRPDGDTIGMSGAGSVTSAPAVQVGHDEIYYAGSSSANAPLTLYDGDTANDTTNNFGNAASPPVALCWDSTNATVYCLFRNGEVCYVTPDSAGGTVIDVGSVYQGANIFMHFGRLLVYNGDALYEVGDPLGTPTSTKIYDDGMGPDAAEGQIATGAGSTGVFPTPNPGLRLATASSEGVWIVKNVAQGGGLTAYITRVDRTNDGTNVGVPVATLPTGTVALDVAYHLGSLLMSASQDIARVFYNNKSTYGYPMVTIYHLTNDSMGSVGSISGGIDPSASAYRFIGSDGANIFIGGESVWAYDGIRGGFHRWFPGSTSYGVAMNLFSTTNTAGEDIHLVNRFGLSTLQAIPLIDEGGSAGTRTLESNYIDGNLPAELKSLVGITLMTDGIKANETWTVSIEADDAGSFTSAAVFDVDGTKTLYKALATAMTGYRFRYKLAWTATGDITSPSRVKGIVLHMVQGEMVTAWQLTLDLSEVRSVENTVLRPEDAVDSLETLMAKQAMTSYVDEFRLSSSTHDVRVDSVQVSRGTPLGGEAVVVLTEQDLDN